MLGSTRTTGHEPEGASLRLARPFKPTKLRRTAFYIASEEIAYVFACSVEKARRRMRFWGFGVKRGRQWYTTRGLIRRCLPDEGEELIALLDHVRAGGKRPTASRAQSIEIAAGFYLPLDQAAAKMGWAEHRLRRRCQRMGGAVKRGGR